MKGYLIAVSVASLWILLPKVRSHPQCLDFRPPFVPSPPPTFCSQYNRFSCCDAAEDNRIRAYHMRTTNNHRRINSDEAFRCPSLMRYMDCLRCSPYSVHIYDAETDGIASDFPGMCAGFCQYFLGRCRTFVRTLTTNTTLIAMAENARQDNQFCRETAVTDTRYCFPDVFFSSQLNRELVQTFSSAEGCICLEEYARNLRNPLIFKHFPDSSNRILIGEQIGVMYVYYKNGSRENDPFLDLRSQVLVSGSGGDERGLLGFAFHPNFAQNRKFYVYFYGRSGRQSVTQLRELTVSSTNRNKANPNSSRLLLELPQPYGNHNGGETTFGTDGYLYLFTGDGGAGGDPGNRAQNRENLLGKALRIDVNVPNGNSARYVIPRDNPFVDQRGSRTEVFAYGLRNPWRCDVDEGDPNTGAGRGRIFCGDVGQGRFEEIDIVQRGKNYGWRIKEGFECYNNPQQNCGRIENEGLPIFAYNRSVGRSVIGGHVYRGCLNPALNGAYILGDYDTGVLFKLEESSSRPGTWEETKLSTCGSTVCRNGLVSAYERNILSFGEDEDGEVYILTTQGASSSRPTGKIYKIIDPRRRGDPARCRSRRRSG